MTWLKANSKLLAQADEKLRAFRAEAERYCTLLLAFYQWTFSSGLQRLGRGKTKSLRRRNVSRRSAEQDLTPICAG